MSVQYLTKLKQHETMFNLFIENKVPVREGFINHHIGYNEFCVPERYTNLNLVGNGPQGLICSALDTVIAQIVLIKKLGRIFRNEINAKKVHIEFKIMQVVHHRNIVRLLDAFTPQKSLEDFQDIYLVMELTGSSLFNLIGLRLSHEQISYLVYQMLCGINHLHLAGIMHRDLNPTNIAVDSDYLLKVTNLEWARSIDSTYALSPHVTSWYYKAPEVALGMDYNETVDIWSIGCIMGEIFQHSVLFAGSDHIDQIKQILEKLGTPSDKFMGSIQPMVEDYLEAGQMYPGQSFLELFPDEIFPADSGQYKGMNTFQARDLLSKMLIIDPEKRISVKDALKHPYVYTWYKEVDVSMLSLVQYDPEVCEIDYSVKQRLEDIYKEITEYENNQQKSIHLPK